MIVVQIDDALKRRGIIPKGSKQEAESAADLCVQQDGNLTGACGEYVPVEWISSH